MISFGTLLMVCSVVTALLASISYALSTRRWQLTHIGRISTGIACGATLLFVALLAVLFITKRYDVAYVAAYSSNELSVPYRIAAIWAGQPGSFAIWALWGLIIAQVLARRTDAAEPYVMSVFMILQATLLAFALRLNPFAPSLDQSGLPYIPSDGDGLNELLENPWMIVHPPVLFAGYALLAVPYAFALGGLWRGDTGNWMRAALPWTLAGWAMLGLALLLGGYWAYETLGWGGYWGWDPVENSALVPWLTTAALIHALLVQRTRGGLPRTSVGLALLTYVLIFYATYLTRSGVLNDFSVHSFAREDLKGAMTIALVVLSTSSCAVFLWRARRLRSNPISEQLLSRDTFLILLVVGLLSLAALITLGTSMPLVSAIPGVGHWLQGILGAAFDLDQGTRFGTSTQPFRDGRFGVTYLFYTTSVPPLGLWLAALLSIGPLLGGRDTNLVRLLRMLRWPFIAAVLVTCSAILLGVRDGLPLVYICLSSFAIGANGVMLIRTMRSGWKRVGGYLAHIGVAILLIGIVASIGYATPEQQIVVARDMPVSAFGYTFAFDGWRVTPASKGVLDLTVTKGASVVRVAPQHYFIPRRNATMTTPAIISGALGDLYITPVSYQAAKNGNTAELWQGIPQTIGPYTIALLDIEQAAEASSAGTRYARLQVRYAEREREIRVPFRLEPDQHGELVLASAERTILPGGHPLVIRAVYTPRDALYVQVDTLNLPVEPGRVVLSVSLKPGMALVWGGSGLVLLGGLMALLRHIAEGRSRRVRQ